METSFIEGWAIIKVMGGAGKKRKKKQIMQGRVTEKKIVQRRSEEEKILESELNCWAHKL